MSSDTSAEFYDAVWRGYAHLDAANPASFHRRRLVRKLLLELSPRALDVLDAGCGRGELLSDLSRALPGARLAGADVSAESLERARALCPSASVFALDLAAGDFDGVHASRFGQYDVVICCEVLEHLADDALAASRLHALLRASGLLIVTVPGGRRSRFDELIGHRRHYTPRSLRGVLESGGFSIERLLSWGFPFHNLYRGAVRLASRFAFEAPKAPESAAPAGLRAEWLGRAYGLFGRALRPLYYVNRPYWGEQLIAVARRR